MLLMFSFVGYKVGRVDQVETALGAEMRLAADKKKGKGEDKDKGKDKIVRRWVAYFTFASPMMTHDCHLASSTRFTPMVHWLTPNYS